MDILPTHTCFDDTFDFIEHIIKEKKYSRQYIIDHIITVHGICVLPNGRRYAHAWIEEGDKCIFKGIMGQLEAFVYADKKGFYEYFDVVKTTHYSLEAIHKYNTQYGNTGPWEEEYKRLCSSDKTRYRPDGDVTFEPESSN